MAIRILSLTSSASRCERTWSCFESVSLPTLCASINSNYVYITCDFRLLTKTKFAYAESYKKKRNKLTCERLNQLVFVQYNNRMNAKKMKAKKNQNMDPLLGTEATKAQGWLVEGGDEEDGEPVSGLTWKLIEEACGVEECGKLRRSARLAQMRDVSEDEFESKKEPFNEDEIDFESDQEDVVPIVGDEEGENDE